MVAVPSALAVNVSPAGNVPVRLIEGNGLPDVFTEKLKGCPVVAVALVALVKAGADSGTTVSVKACVAAPAALVAVNVTGKVPPVVGVPESVAVPLTPAVKLTPLGSAPLSLTVAAG